MLNLSKSGGTIEGQLNIKYSITTTTPPKKRVKKVLYDALERNTLNRDK